MGENREINKKLSWVFTILSVGELTAALAIVAYGLLKGHMSSLTSNVIMGAALGLYWLLADVAEPFAVHRFDITHTHETNDRLYISYVTFTVIPKRIGSQVTNQIGDPIVKPVVYGHIRVGSNNMMPQFILRICQPILCLGQRLEVFFFSAACFGIASCGI